MDEGAMTVEDYQPKPVQLFSTKQAFLMANMTSYQGGMMFLNQNPQYRPARKRRQLAWTMEEIVRLQDAYWKKTERGAKGVIASIIQRASA